MFKRPDGDKAPVLQQTHLIGTKPSQTKNRPRKRMKGTCGPASCNSLAAHLARSWQALEPAPCGVLVAYALQGKLVQRSLKGGGLMRQKFHRAPARNVSLPLMHSGETRQMRFCQH